jgi:adenylylsulfate reductase, subunit A
MDEENWKCFANCTRDPNTGEWKMFKRDIIPIFGEASDHETIGG